MSNGGSSVQIVEGGRGSLTIRILVGMGAGLAVGLLLNAIGVDGVLEDWLVDGLFDVVGQIFLASLKLLVVPLVFVSLVCGTAALEDIAKLGRIGARTVALYLCTTAVAITLALLTALVVRPGAGFDLETEARFSAVKPPSLKEVLIGIFPSNPVEAMAEGHMLQIIVFAGLFGLALTLAGEAGRRLLGTFRDLNSVVMRLVMLLMSVAPYGVFCLIARVFASQGFEAFAPLASYFCVVLGVLLLHAAFTYSTLLRLLVRVNPLTFFRNMRAPIAVAFSTASSNATLPVTLETVELSVLLTFVARAELAR